MYDSVHLFKNMYFNLLNKKQLHCPPLDAGGPPLDVHLSRLEKVHSIEYSSDAKMAYRLTDKVLHPTSIERVNVQLAVAATHETTIAALRYYGQHAEYGSLNGTAEFLHQVRRWFDIVNVKSPGKHVRRNDSTLQPISTGDEKGLAYIEKFGKMMLRWEAQGNKKTQMSLDTIRGVAATCRGLVGLAKYLLRQCDLEYVLLGKIQSDRLEGHFGHLRKLAGGNFWASSRQFFEGEAIVRVKSLIWLSGYGLSTVTAGMHPVSQQRLENDQRAVTEITEYAAAASSDDPAQDVPEGTQQALHHIAGYLAHSVKKIHRCDECRALLSDGLRAQLVTVVAENAEEKLVAASFTDLLNRGKLLQPSELCLRVVMEVCQLYRLLVNSQSETRTILFGSSSPKNVFRSVVENMLGDDEELKEVACGRGHKFTSNILATMAGALFNVFVSNHVKDVNSQVHSKKRKGPPTRTSGRGVDSDKIRKLTGAS
ncbi:hypothetical protein FJT64_000977 [Amphibalanus amphitrite]|uniref:Transposable element P transposase n=1 Tax=Amphibalanus amphitrite TaxID=1232801 RepID=A0A6A4VGH2_AMPAM|nr:hypothetical protein FJT64_000977 [Amphibalanus amphitrite]